MKQRHSAEVFPTRSDQQQQPNMIQSRAPSIGKLASFESSDSSKINTSFNRREYYFTRDENTHSQRVAFESKESLLDLSEGLSSKNWGQYPNPVFQDFKRTHQKPTFSSSSSHCQDTIQTNNSGSLMLESSQQNHHRPQQEDESSNILILQAPTQSQHLLSESHNNPTTRSHDTNPKLKQLLANVQLQSRRLIPYTPITTTDILNSSRVTHPSKSDASTKQSTITAAKFAVGCAKAGYLNKLGANYSEYKRRFFVLKPTTSLYYFLSPDDEEPRGCIDLESIVSDNESCDIQIREYGCVADGKFRFEIVLPTSKDVIEATNNDNKKDVDSVQQTIMLEASNETIGREWIKSLTVERNSFLKTKINQLHYQIEILEEDKKKYKRQVDNFRHVEKDRDGAIQDARELRDQLDKMDHALGVLRRLMSRPPEIEDESNKDDKVKGGDDAHLNNANGHHDKVTGPMQCSKQKACCIDDDDLAKIDVSSTHFYSLSNTCRGLRENLRLTSIENNKLLYDVSDINQKKRCIEESVNQAEKVICKLWENNVQLRDTIKRRKDEKKILIKEVKRLGGEIKQLKAENEFLKRTPIVVEDCSEVKDTCATDHNKLVQIATSEKKLLTDLEDHVAKSLELHEQFLRSRSPICISTSIQKNEAPSINEDPIKEMLETAGDSSTENACSDVDSDMLNRTFSPLRPKSLMNNILLDVNAISADATQHFSRTNSPQHIDTTSQNHQQYPDLIGQDSQFDRIEVKKYPSDHKISLSTSASIITNNCLPTSKLICPLTDVTQVKSNEARPSLPSSSSSSSSSSLRSATDIVEYDIKFHSQKIGLQFQKVATTSSSGLLSEAMTIHTNNCTISDQSNEFPSSRAISVDTVLVCGFAGFDDGVNRMKPSLGARLIAVDGVSVEKGPWTFQSVKNVIRSRGRPITLTFRDEYLTTSQRCILTKAAAEIKSSEVRHPPDNYKEVNVNNTHTLSRTLHHDQLVNAPKSESGVLFDRDAPEIIQASNNRHRYSNIHNRDYQSNDSDFLQADTWRSFSDVESTGSLTQKTTPFLNGLISQLSSDGTPEYLRHGSDSLHSNVYHQNWQANLL